MLCEFRVKNFLSFADEQVFSMEANKTRNNMDRLYADDRFKLVKFKAIYGANASGKSNLVDAMSFAQTVILRGIPHESDKCYCRISQANEHNTSEFKFTIIVDEIKYTYGFTLLLSSRRIVSESLHQYKYGTTWKEIFSRDVLNGTYSLAPISKDSELNSRLKNYMDDVKSDERVLFLHIMNHHKDSLYENYPSAKIFKQIFNWFQYDFNVTDPEMPIDGYSYLLDSENVEQIGKMLSDFGTGISKVVLTEIPQEKVAAKISRNFFNEITSKLENRQKFYEDRAIKQTPAVILGSKQDNVLFIIELDNDEIKCKTIEFQHENTDATFSLSEESDGTNRLLDLIEVLLSKDNGKVYVIDELNRTFHPMLTYKFVEDFLALAKERNIQLIVTTHESFIMDLDLLRQDEIAFVDRDEYGKSIISHLTTYKARSDKKVLNSYLDGEFNGLPRIKTGRSKKSKKANEAIT